MTARPAHPVDDAILAVLRGSFPVPLATPQVIDRVYPGATRASVRGRLVCQRLAALKGRGLVAAEKLEGMRFAYWRLAGPPPVPDPTLQQLDRSLREESH